jgi:hypothetical protein
VVRAQNTIIARNFDHSSGAKAPDCSGPGTLISGGHNLIGDDLGCTFTAASGDQVGTSGSPINPLLVALANNGGFTKTMALKSGSPAINHGSPLRPGSGGTACAAKDQRGVKRPQGPRCDIGAYERKQS